MPARAGDSKSIQGFLSAVASYALTEDAIGVLPLSAAEFLRRLRSESFGSLDEIVSELASLSRRPAELSRRLRGISLAVCLVTYLGGSAALGALWSRIGPRLMFADASASSMHASTAGVLSVAALALLCAFALRGGFWLRAFGIAVVTKDGLEASRFRALIRAAIAWSWVPVQMFAMSLGGWLLCVELVKFAALVYAADYPARGLHDRLAGTHLVPR